ncbi:MAG TPA: glycosyltransferase family 4 protein [Terriglobales bacterium]|nr:glycosyltransferase family 4 protein [Terriglobales bacterium]
MMPIRVLVDSFADAGLLNAQMSNAREIVCRLDPDCFTVSMFVQDDPDPRIASRRNTRLVRVPQKKQTLRILSEFLFGSHNLVFYVKASPASRCYLGLRRRWRDPRITVATIESQADLRSEPSIAPEAVRLWEQTVLRCDYLFSNSASVRGSLEREYGLISQIIPTGVDTSFFAPPSERHPPNPRPRVLFAGSLRRFKQPGFLLSAAARFPEADFRIAGEGPLRQELEQRIAQENLTNAHLLGPLSPAALREEYQRADIFLFPSSWEGSPKVILEAAASGLPVIVRSNYAPETVVHGVTGYQASSDEELYKFLQALLQNAELRRQLGMAGRSHSQKYDWNVIAAQWGEAFTEMAHRSQTRRAS